MSVGQEIRHRTLSGSPRFVLKFMLQFMLQGDSIKFFWGPVVGRHWFLPAYHYVMCTVLPVLCNHPFHQVLVVAWGRWSFVRGMQVVSPCPHFTLRLSLWGWPASISDRFQYSNMPPIMKAGYWYYQMLGQLTDNSSGIRWIGNFLKSNTIQQRLAAIVGALHHLVTMLHDVPKQAYTERKFLLDCCFLGSVCHLIKFSNQWPHCSIVTGGAVHFGRQKWLCENLINAMTVISLLATHMVLLTFTLRWWPHVGLWTQDQWHKGQDIDQKILRLHRGRCGLTLCHEIWVM